MNDALAAAIEQASDPTGVVRGLSNKAYHSGPGISKSGLDLVNRCPAKYFAHYLDPAAPPEKERGGQLLGTLTHSAILEPEEFERRYVPTEARRGTNEWLNIKDQADVLGQQLVPASDYRLAAAMARAVRKNSEAAHLLSKGEPELSCYWRDPATGVLVRVRPDWVHPVGNEDILVDVKTIDDASKASAKRQIARKRYDVQAALYSDGWALGSGRPVRAFVFLFVETEYPHICQPFMVDENRLELARQAYREDLEIYAQCLESGEWPGYSTTIEEIIY